MDSVQRSGSTYPREMQDELIELQSRMNKTIVFVTLLRPEAGTIATADAQGRWTALQIVARPLMITCGRSSRVSISEAYRGQHMQLRYHRLPVTAHVPY